MPTLFVEADEPLLVFPSAEVAERYLEAVDVRAGVYQRAFDAAGQQFSIDAVGNAVVIRPAAAPADIEGLATLLRRSLAAVGESAPGTASAADLVAAAEAFWSERDPVGDRFTKPLPWWGCALLILAAATIVALLWRLVASIL